MHSVFGPRCYAQSTISVVQSSQGHRADWYAVRMGDMMTRDFFAALRIFTVTTMHKYRSPMYRKLCRNGLSDIVQKNGLVVDGNLRWYSESPIKDIWHLNNGSTNTRKQRRNKHFPRAFRRNRTSNWSNYQYFVSMSHSNLQLVRTCLLLSGMEADSHQCLAGYYCLSGVWCHMSRYVKDQIEIVLRLFFIFYVFSFFHGYVGEEKRVDSARCFTNRPGLLHT